MEKSRSESNLQKERLQKRPKQLPTGQSDVGSLQTHGKSDKKSSKHAPKRQQYTCE